MRPEQLKCLNAGDLKLIAVITMTLDHAGCILFPYVMWLRIIGRLAFPLYAFLLVQGYMHTGNVKKYLLRLGLLAVLSEIPFNMMTGRTLTDPAHQNVFFTLFIGLLTLTAMDWMLRHLPAAAGGLYLLPALAGCLAAMLVACDYSYYGVLIIVLFYVGRNRLWYQFLGVGVIFFLIGGLQLYAVASFLPIAMYNGKKGCSNKVCQWLFYFYYPLHLSVLCGIWFVFRT